jgi:hypothetical protein
MFLFQPLLSAWLGAAHSDRLSPALPAARSRDSGRESCSLLRLDLESRVSRGSRHHRKIATEKMI